ncbi:MAG TPA: ATP-binding cassette domain-containing protein [Solirubrobacteraceae bacterium]|nr:ATP-binding cassette domain-containing protein [Solirubrobacteraceae bacterium]
MSALLEFQHVSKSYVRGSDERVVLDDVSLEIDAGELVAIWGERRSGRSTLLRLAAGIEAPNSGRVRFAGCDLTDRGNDVRGQGIGYCRTVFRPAEGQVVLALLVMGQLARGVSPTVAQARARHALKRAGAEDCAARGPNELDSAEVVRVAIARALIFQPRLLVLDEPTKGVDSPERDEILQLLRSLADEGIAVLTSGSLAGADRALSLGRGKLRGSLTPTLASVTQLPRIGRSQANA